MFGKREKQVIKLLNKLLKYSEMKDLKRREYLPVQGDSADISSCATGQGEGGMAPQYMQLWLVVCGCGRDTLFTICSLHSQLIATLEVKEC